MSSSTAPISNNGVSDIFTITNPRDGSKATVHSQGGHVVSWVGTDGDERLYMSPAHKFAQNKAIRGGAPIIFPQFSDMGNGPAHGVARARQWKRIDDGSIAGQGVFAFKLAKDDKQFPNAASVLTLTVTVSDGELSLAARVSATTDTIDKDFGLLFHTYFAVSDVNAVRIEGFEGKKYANGLKKRIAETSPADYNSLKAVVDSIYYKNRDPIRVVDEGLGRTLVISGSATIPDVVLWNPGAETIGKFGDLPQPDGYKKFICVEHGAVGPRAPFPSSPTAQPWEGTQTIRVVKHNQKKKATVSKL